MVLQLFLFKVSSGFLLQDSQSSYSFDKIQKVGGAELSEEYIYIFMFIYGRNIYANMLKTLCPPGYNHNGFLVTHVLAHMRQQLSTVGTHD